MYRRPRQVVLANKQKEIEKNEAPQKSSYIATLKGIVSLLPIFTILIIIIGFFKLNLFYSGFGINIFHFVKISEVIVLVAMDLITLFLSVIGTILFTIIPSIYNDSEANLRQSQKAKDGIKSSFLKRYRLRILLLPYKDKITKGVLLFIRIALIWLIIYSVSMILNYSTYEEKLQGIALLLLTLPFTIPALSLSFMEAIFTTAESAIGLIIFVMTSFFFLLTIETEYTETKSGKYQGTSVICKDTTQKHISTKDYFYIGKTENYIFFYNSKDSSSNIIPVSEVKVFHLSKH